MMARTKTDENGGDTVTHTTSDKKLVKTNRLTPNDTLLDIIVNNNIIWSFWWDAKHTRYSVAKRPVAEKYEEVVLRTRSWSEAKKRFEKQ